MALLYEKKGKIAHITINRPEKMNAIDPETMNEITESFCDFSEDDELWVAILTGAGNKAFSAGVDLSQKKRPGAKLPVADIWKKERIPPFNKGGLNQIWKPIIAAINGYCLAGGLALAMSCDIRIASENATFGAPEGKWGVLHAYGALRLIRTVPTSVVMEMILTGESIDAHEAHRVGIVSRVVPQENLMPTAEKIANKICENSPLAARIHKEVIARSYDMPCDDAIRFIDLSYGTIQNTEDIEEGPRAFTERRKPVYKAR